MSPVGAIFVRFPPKTGTNLLHPRPHQSLNGSLITFDRQAFGVSVQCSCHPQPKAITRSTSTIDIAFDQTSQATPTIQWTKPPRPVVHREFSHHTLWPQHYSPRSHAFRYGKQNKRNPPVSRIEITDNPHETEMQYITFVSSLFLDSRTAAF